MEKEYAEELKKIETRQEAWKFIRRERRTWTVVSGRISIEDWREHFMTKLEGSSQQQTNVGIETEGDEEIDREKIIIMNSQMRK